MDRRSSNDDDRKDPVQRSYVSSSERVTPYVLTLGRDLIRSTDQSLLITLELIRETLCPVARCRSRWSSEYHQQRSPMMVSTSTTTNAITFTWLVLFEIISTAPESESFKLRSIPSARIRTQQQRSKSLFALSDAKESFREPKGPNAQYGRQDYWNQFYESSKDEPFSWYTGWDDLEAFVREFLDTSDRILVPGVGNDAAIVGMYDAGFHYLTAMDYAPEGIERCREMLGDRLLKRKNSGDKEKEKGVELLVADARQLTGVFRDHSFDGVLEKGTLDAIYLSGGEDKATCEKNLNAAISELGRCVKPGGIWMSVAAVVVDQIQSSFTDRTDEWEELAGKDDMIMTSDGYASNNVDGNIMVWRKR